MPERHKFSVGAFAIILDENRRVLLCHRTDKDLWNLPGGGLEEGETPWEGVLREVKEEVGVEARVEKLIGVYYKSQKDEFIFSFLCSVVSGDLTLTNEADKIEYFELNKIPENMVGKQLERIKDYFADSNKTWMKTHP